jgi:hypothetical protein
LNKFPELKELKIFDCVNEYPPVKLLALESRAAWQANLKNIPLSVETLRIERSQTMFKNLELSWKSRRDGRGDPRVPRIRG